VTIVPGARTLGSQAFSPNPLTVPAGATVTWTNADTSTHGAVNDSGAFAGGTAAPGGTISATFPTPGTYAYHCPIHSGMTGSIIVQ
jgi:plastocyanin